MMICLIYIRINIWYNIVTLVLLYKLNWVFPKADSELFSVHLDYPLIVFANFALNTTRAILCSTHFTIIQISCNVSPAYLARIPFYCLIILSSIHSLYIYIFDLPSFLYFFSHFSLFSKKRKLFLSFLKQFIFAIQYKHIYMWI